MTLDFAWLAKTLTESLQLKLAPVGVCIMDAAPPGVKTFDGRVAAGCKFWELAAKEVFATAAEHHALCAIGIYTHNLETSPRAQQDLGDALKVFADLGYVREEDLPLIPVLERKAKVVVYGPLGQLPAAPDTVLLFVHPAQILILSEAAQQVEMTHMPALGRPACGIVPQAINTGRAALSLGCCGARAYVEALHDDTALFAIPGPRLAEYAGRIAALAKANSVLSAFHTLRKTDVECGLTPSVKESLVRLQSQS